jgi:predicted HTH transcriptional regulator
MTTAVENLIRKFATDLQVLIRGQLAEEVNGAVRSALGEKSGSSRKAQGSAVRHRGPAGRRSPEAIEKQADKLFALITKNPDQRSEQIAQATGISTGDLVRPLRKLLAEKKIKASGKARGTTYAAAK